MSHSKEQRMNTALRNEFKQRGLDLSRIFYPSSHDLKSENHRLKSLLKWVNRYSQCKNRKLMEAEGYDYPPVDPGTGPDNDWDLFERWMNGKPTSASLEDILFPDKPMTPPDKLTDEQIESELERIQDACEPYNIFFDFRKNVPSRLIYEYVYNTRDQQHSLLARGETIVDSCRSYCPECIQRPWCEVGQSNCWLEDEDEGKMYLSESLKGIVSSLPGSLEILKSRSDDF